MPPVIETEKVLEKLKFMAPLDMLEQVRDLKAAVILPSALVGTWINCDRQTRGLKELVISASGAGITVHGFGACTPTPCDWKAVPGLVYADNVTSAPAVAFTAVYNFGFKDTIVVGHLDAGLIRVETFDHFKDESGRSDYYARYFMEKA